MAIRLNGHLSNQLWLPSHHYGRVPLVVHLHLNNIVNNSFLGSFWQLTNCDEEFCFFIPSGDLVELLFFAWIYQIQFLTLDKERKAPG